MMTRPSRDVGDRVLRDRLAAPHVAQPVGRDVVLRHHLSRRFEVALDVRPLVHDEDPFGIVRSRRGEKPRAEYRSNSLLLPGAISAEFLRESRVERHIPLRALRLRLLNFPRLCVRAPRDTDALLREIDVVPTGGGPSTSGRIVHAPTSPAPTAAGSAQKTGSADSKNHTHFLVVPNARKRLSKPENLLVGDVLGFDSSAHGNSVKHFVIA